MFNNFNDFILAIYAINKEAARWLARECLKKEEGEHLSLLNYSPLEHQEKIILLSLFKWEDSPQGHEFWKVIYNAIRDIPIKVDKVEVKLDDNF